MLALDDRRWSELTDAYGPATGVPERLRAVAADPVPGGSKEAWFALWSGLCHQGDAYPSSFAAVPHLVETARVEPGPIDFSFLLLPVCIELARLRGRGGSPDLDDEYRDSISALAAVVVAHAAEPWDVSMSQAAASALALAKGHVDLAEAFSELDAEWIMAIVNDDR